MGASPQQLVWSPQMKRYCFSPRTGPRVPLEISGILDWPSTMRKERVLELAFDRRSCFICEKYGDCKHREHSLELVIAQFVGIGGELK
jgi:hypothetical protein